MFEATVTKFVKAVGEESLLAVPSLDQAEQCRPMHIVVKKNRRWFWEKARYESSSFQLHDLLTKPELVPVELNRRKLVTYNKTHTFSINGSIGAKLKSLLGAELEGSDTVSVRMPLGEVYKFEVDQQDLLEKLETRYLDLGHEFIKQVASHPRKVLCLIVGTAFPLEDCVLTTSTKVSGDEDFDIDKVVDVNEHGSISSGNQSSMTVPKNTPLAYNALELQVGADGSIMPLVDPDSRGGFTKEDETEGPDLLDDEEYYEIVYKGIHQLPEHERRELSMHVQNICGYPADVHVLYDTIKAGCTSAETGEEKMVPISEFHAKLKGKPKDYMYLLTKAGFKDQGDMLAYPTEPSPFLEASMCLIEALIQLDDEETLAFKDCNKNLAKPLMFLLESAIDDKPVKISDADLSPLYAESNTGQTFAQALGFQVQSDGTLLPPAGDRSELEGAFRVLHALWGETDEDTDKPGKSRCNIL